MKLSAKTISDKAIWLLSVFLFTSFVIFNQTSWGRYAFFGASVAIAILSAISYDGVLRIRLQAYHGFFAAFILYAAMSSVWAQFSQTDATVKAKTLVQIFGCSALLYLHYDRKGSAAELISAIKWSGFIVTLYAIAFYGLDAMLESAQSDRLDNEFENVNTIAMAAALSCMLLWHDLMNRKNLWSAVMLAPAVILITATQSRKAFVLLLAGVFGIYVLHTFKQKGFGKKIFRVILYVVILYVGLRLLLKLPIFSGSLERMEQMLNFWTEGGKVDHSTEMRNQMAQLGMEWWKKYPLLGIGIGNPHVLAARELNFDAYLHNNFVEMLCAGGIVGFGIYYGMYAYLIYGLIKYRKADPEIAGLALIWLGILLIMNYGMVTYYSKTQWYYLLVHFVNVSNLRTKYREMMANEAPAEEGN